MFTVREYLRFSKFAVILRLELTVIVRGFSSEDVPVQPMKIYSASGMAVIVSKVSDAIEPPVVSTEPPSEAEAAILKKTVGASASVCSSKASF